MDGVATATDSELTVHIPGLDEFTMIQVGTVAYLPAFTRPGWSAFDGPPNLVPDAAEIFGGQDPLAFLDGIATADGVEVRGSDRVDGEAVTVYRARIDLVDALQYSQDLFDDDLGISQSEFDSVIANAGSMQFDLSIDDAGFVRRTALEYSLMGIDFEMTSELSPLEDSVIVRAPSDDEIVSRHEAGDITEFQELISSHIVQFAGA